jgi:hypothetical protein
MSKITLIHFVPGDHIALTPQAIMKHLGAQAIHDFGSNANPAPAAVRDLIRLARRNKHVAALTIADNSVQETLNRLIKRDDLAIDVQHTSYSLIAGQILNIQNLDFKSVEKCAEEFSAAIIDGMAPGEAIRKAMTERPDWTLIGRRKDTGENVPDRLWPTPTYRFPHVPVNFEVPHKKAHIRGVANGATMYAMGLVEGMAIGDRYITLIVNGDEDVKKIFIDYPFINWDSGRIQVRTVSEVLMVSAEDKAALGYAEWVADVTPDNLKALLELDQWQHFVGFLSGDKFDRFTKEYSQ